MAEQLLPDRVSNFDIAGICNRVTMYAIEIQSSATAYQGGTFLEADMKRAASYFDRIDECITAFNKTPLDMPKVSNFTFAVLKPFPQDPDLEQVENQDVGDILRRLKALWIEAANSQSADLSSGINSFDVERFRGILGSCRDVLNMAADSMDLPENPSNTPIPTGGNGDSRSRAGGGRRF